MTEEITIALITAAVTLAVCLINNIFQNRKNREQNQTNTELLNYKLTQLSDRVDKHNNLVERMYHLEQKVAVHLEHAEGVEEKVNHLEEMAEGK